MSRSAHRRGHAFGLFEKRACEPGHDVEDWLEAEHELTGSCAAELTEKNRVNQWTEFELAKSREAAAAQTA
jgi:hypothetical protein